MHLAFALLIERMMGIVLGVLVVADSFSIIHALSDLVRGMFSSIFTSQADPSSGARPSGRWTTPRSRESLAEKVSRTMEDALEDEIQLIDKERIRYVAGERQRVKEMENTLKDEINHVNDARKQQEAAGARHGAGAVSKFEVFHSGNWSKGNRK